MAITRTLAALPQELAALVSASPHPELLLSADFSIVAASEAYLELLEAPAQAVVGRDIRKLFEGSPALTGLVASLETVARLGTKHWMGHGAFLLPGRERTQRAAPGRGQRPSACRRRIDRLDHP